MKKTEEERGKEGKEQELQHPNSFKHTYMSPSDDEEEEGDDENHDFENHDPTFESTLESDSDAPFSAHNQKSSDNPRGQGHRWLRPLGSDSNASSDGIENRPLLGI